jgi:hypothetical protein
MDHKIVDNFLTQDEFNAINENLLCDYFPWYLNPFRIHPNYEVEKSIEIFDYQFTHCFYRNFQPTSDFFHLVNPLIKKINPLSIIRVKANLIPGFDRKIVYGYHTDFDDSRINSAVYYVNTNNGATIFKEGFLVESIENRIVFFNSSKLHTGTNATDSKYRCVININYIK